jgi:carbamoyl-phosphate synthase large subunit
MPKRTDIHSILIIGAGPIIIGQACEFDYSGAQACKALREEGYRVILVNSNPATIMTDPNMADVTYIEPITWRVLENIIAKERPDAVLPTMGGQTALNCALDLAKHGVLEKYSVEMIGASREAIDMAEDREKFKQAMTRIGLGSARSGIAHSMEEAQQVQGAMGFPTIIRPSFTMGGSGGGIAYNQEEFIEICKRGLEASPTKELLIEESLLGWKEYEMEVVRDRKDNCIIVCSIENLDPMGVHTGDSITVAPAQTLTDREYQIMRNASIAVLREIGVDTGGSNVQFAINPKNGAMVVIEMNPRVSRSSALASKATGFPIAKVAAKLAVGYTLDELKNDITGGATPASFEPSIDYVVTKVPRFAFEKFPQANDRLTTQMKSVGEVMAIGRSFQESMQKALRGLEVSVYGFDEIDANREEINRELASPGPQRIWYVAQALREGYSLQEVFDLTSIDPWFLVQIEEIITVEGWMRSQNLDDLDAVTLRNLKRKGFRTAASVPWSTPARILPPVPAARPRCASGATRSACARCSSASTPAPPSSRTHTAYMYSTYEEECEANRPSARRSWCSAAAPTASARASSSTTAACMPRWRCARTGYETIMVNCNPETVSTDYDTSDRLYFEPLTLEDMLEIVHVEQPTGVIVQFGGQTPLKRARDLEANGVPIIGTSPDMIDAAEDRERFQKLLHDLGLKQPPNRTARTEPDAIRLAAEIGYPLVVRPSYVLGGRAMEIVHEQKDLERYMRDAVKVSNDSPVLLDRFLNDATEVDVDALCDGKQVLIGGIMEHIEQAGVHSGDSACSLPPFSCRPEMQDELRRQTKSMAKGLNVVGLMNVQFAIQGRGDGLRAGSESARLAHGALRVQGDQPAAGQDRGALHGGAQPGRAGRDARDHPALLLGEGSGVPLHQVPRGRHHPRSGDEVHRRGDGRRARPSPKPSSSRNWPPARACRSRVGSSSASSRRTGRRRSRWRASCMRSVLRWSPRAAPAAPSKRPAFLSAW